MKSIILLFGLFFFNGFVVNAQTYKPDKYGHISDPKFLKLIKDRGYQLVGAMDSVAPESKTDPVHFMITKVAKDKKELFLDWNGVEYADRNALRRAFGHQEVYPKTERPLYSDDNPFYNDSKLPGIERVYLDPKIYGPVYKGEKMGYRIKNDTVVPAIYDKVTTIQSDGKLYLRVSSGSLQGLYDIFGKLLIPVAYEEIDVAHKGSPRISFTVKQNGKYGILSSKAEVSIPCIHSAVLSWSSDEELVIMMKKQGYKTLRGALDTNGRVIAPAIYSSITRYDGMNCFIVNSGKKGIIDLAGNLVLDTIYSDISKFKGDLYKFELHLGDNKYSNENLEGLFDVKNVKLILPCEYQLPMFWMEEDGDIICISKPDKGEERQLGLMNIQGEIILEPVYSALEYLKDQQLVIVAKNGLYGVINLDQQAIIPFKYQGLDYIASERENKSIYPNGILVFVTEDKWGIMNLKEEVIIPSEYDKLEPTPLGIFYTRNNGFGVMDLQQKPLIEEQANSRYFSFKNGVIEFSDSQRNHYYMDFYGNKVLR